MKKWICLLLSLCLTLGLVSGAVAAENNRYLALGDSITAGTGLNEGESAFPQILAEQNGYELNNQGVDGNTAVGLMASFADGSLDEAISGARIITITSGGNDLLDLLYELIAEAYNAKYDPDITPDDVLPILADSDDSRWMNLLLCGMDVLEGDDQAGVPPFARREEFLAEVELFIDNLNQVTAYILERNPDVNIIVPTQYNPYKDFSGLYKVLATSMDEAARVLNGAIQANAEAGGYLVADVFTAFQNSSEKLCNATTSPMNLDFHPNAAGHALMAQVIQQVIDQLPEPEPTEPEPTELEPTEPEPTEPEPTEPEPTEPEPTEPEPTEPEPTEPEPTEPRENPFTDVDEDDYYYESVLWAVDRGVTSGMSATKFGPGVSCTRGQVVTFLWRAAGSPAPVSQTNPFRDVQPSDYYYNAVLWAVEQGITSGVSADRFGPGQSCTRAQVVTFLWAAQGRPQADEGRSFTDVASGAYYYDAVAWAVESGITSGVGEGRFGPGSTCTRGQIVTFLYKAYV